MRGVFMFQYNLTDNVSDSVERMLGLIQRNGPRFLRIGGTVSERGEMLRQGQPVGASERMEMLRLARKGYRLEAIAAYVDRSTKTVRRVCREGGLVFVRGQRQPAALAPLVPRGFLAK